MSLPAISRTQINTVVQGVVIVAAKEVDGTITLRLETPTGTYDCPMAQSAMVALGNSLINTANS